MPARKSFKICCQIALMVFVSVMSAFLFPTVMVAQATTTNLSMPNIQVCQSVGSTITVALTASSVTNVNGWQVNVTFSDLRVVDQVVGSSWTGSSYFAANNTNSGSTLFGFSFQNNASFTSATPVTMLTMTFRIMSRFAFSTFHIVLASEHDFGTVLLSPGLTSQTYTTTDGSFLNCIDGPMMASSPNLSPKSSSAPPAPDTESPAKPPATVFYLTALQALPTNNYVSDITLPSGDRVSWGFEATGLVYHNGTSRTWGRSNFGQGVKIAILDTGVNGTQLPDLQGQVVAYYNYFSATEDQYDHNGHGTAMASIVASKHDGTGLAGVAYNAQIYSGKVFNRTGGATTASITAGINWAVSQGVNIISMSFGGAGSCPSDIQSAINNATGRGITVVAAAGNIYPPRQVYQGYDSVASPANCVGVFPITSYGLTPFNPPFYEANGFNWQCANFGLPCPTGVMHGILSQFSLEGPAVRFAAPGSHILSWRRGNIRYENGTSPATAFAAGLLALGYNRYGTYFNPTTRLWEMAAPVFSGQQDSFFGYGLLNATRMLTHNSDINGDNKVDVLDLSLLGAVFLKPVPPSPAATDVNWDGIVNVLDLVSIGAKFGRLYSAPPSRNVWGPNANDYPSVFLSQQQSAFLAIMGECNATCSGDSVTLSATINPAVATYVTPTSYLRAVYVITYANGTQQVDSDLITLPANAGGQTFSTSFSVPSRSFRLPGKSLVHNNRLSA